MAMRSSWVGPAPTSCDGARMGPGGSLSTTRGAPTTGRRVASTVAGVRGRRHSPRSRPTGGDGRSVPPEGPGAGPDEPLRVVLHRRIGQAGPDIVRTEGEMLGSYTQGV